MKRRLALVLALALIFMLGSSYVMAARPPKTALDVTISAPQDGIFVENGGTFSVTGSVLAKRGDAGLVETFVQYAKGEGSTDFRNVDGADLQIISGNQPQTYTLPRDVTYAVNWVLTGNPGTYEVRIHSQGETAKSGSSESRTVTIMGAPPPPGVFYVDNEYQDPAVGFGSAVGAYSNTFDADGVYEMLSEERNRQGTKKPVDDTTELGWIFEFNELDSRSDTTLYLLGHAGFTSGDSDSIFYLQAQISGQWMTVATIGHTNADLLIYADIPDDVSETIHVRAIDNDQTVGNKEISSLYLDQLYVCSESISSGVEILVDTGSTRVATWENLNQNWYETYGFEIAGYYANDIVVVDIDSDGQNEIVTGCSAPVGTIQIFEAQPGSVEPTHSMIQPPSGSQVTDLAVGDFDNDGGSYLEILSCTDAGKTATIWKMGSTTYVPLLNIALPGFGDAVAAGNLDEDDEIELVLTAGITVPGVAMVYEYSSGTWTKTAEYQYPEGDPMDDYLSQAEINDVDRDGQNEIILSYPSRPLHVLDYTGSELVEVWGLGPEIPIMNFVTGDATNDGLVDIVAVGPETIYIFEAIGGVITNTITIHEPELGCSHNGMALGDIDGDGKNEYVIVWHYLWIFQNDTRIGKKPVDYSYPNAITIGDYDNDAS